MIEAQVMTMPEVVDHFYVGHWQRTIKAKAFIEPCPPEVEEFINAVHVKLGDFAQYGREHEYIEGSELLLCGLTEWEGEQIFSFATYPLHVPKMQAVEHRTSMHRLFQKKGKQGLIDYVKARTKGTPLQHLLEVLNVHVFHQERPEFVTMMEKIKQAQKL